MIIAFITNDLIDNLKLIMLTKEGYVLFFKNKTLQSWKLREIQDRKETKQYLLLSKSKPVILQSFSSKGTVKVRQIRPPP